MLILILALLTLCTPFEAVAGRHNERRFSHRRISSSRSISRRDACTLGQYQCQGDDLQWCYNGQWNHVQTCSGGLTCAASVPNAAPGCIWASTSAPAAPTNNAPSTTPSPAADPASPPAGKPPNQLVGNPVVEAANAPNEQASPNGNQAPSPSSTPPANPPSPSPSSPGSPVDAVKKLGAVSDTKDDTGTGDPNAQGSGNGGNDSSTNNTSSGDSGTTTGNSDSKGSPPNTNYQPPHWVVYANNGSVPFGPSASQVTPINRFIMSFWQTWGPGDDAMTFADLDTSKKQAMLADYHGKGIALMVSAFGSVDYPTTNQTGPKDPTKTAQDLAKFVKANSFDGVDVDYEGEITIVDSTDTVDSTAFSSGKAEPWLITFHKELRSELPSPYIISHAPQAPHFSSSQAYPGGAYRTIHKTIGSTIDFYNIQYYNQGLTAYTECDELIHSSTNQPGTSILDIHQDLGIPLSQLVIGKPLHTYSTETAGSGLMTAQKLASCVAEVQGIGGVSVWQWDPSAQSFFTTVAGGK